MTTEIDVIVVGSGPTGVSVAWPLVKAGLRVVMIDAGSDQIPAISSSSHSLAGLRKLGHPPKQLVASFTGTQAQPGASPRGNLLNQKDNSDAYASINRLNSKNFALIGSLATGGLSNVWGASVSTFDSTDMLNWPIKPDDLAPHYRTVAERIGLSGVADDAMAEILGRNLTLDPSLPVTGAARSLLESYTDRAASDLSLGLARNAVITQNRGMRYGCTLDKSCALGCAVGAVYNSAHEIVALAENVRFQLIGNTAIEEISRSGNQLIARGKNRQSGKPFEISAPKIVLSAGVLATTRLALSALGHYEKDICLANAPAMSLAFLIPKRFGTALDDQGYGMAQLSFSMPLNESKIFGLLYEADSFFAADLAAYSPLSRSGTCAILHRALPSLLFGMLYFPSQYSKNTVRLQRNGNLTITGGEAANLAEARRHVIKRVRSAFSKLGAWLLPIVSRSLLPGSEVHYAGTLAMGGLTNVAGQVNSYPGLYIADASLLPNLPSKSHTFTAMANADRVGEGLAREILNVHSVH
jgi:choline dehydrogenase-like flavoprotein